MSRTLAPALVAALPCLPEIAAFHGIAGDEAVLTNKRANQQSISPASLDLDHLNSDNGFSVAGELKYEGPGYSVSAAGDINGDQVGDLVLGSRKPFPATFDLRRLDGKNGFALPGLSNGGRLGASVGTAGDINGDGVADLAIGPDPVYPGLGTGHVIFGSRRPFPASFNLHQLDGAHGFTIPRRHFYGSLGMSVNAARDINGDQVDDLAVGVHLDHDGHGASYLLFGKKQLEAD